jgi:hypothetical protein
MTRPPEERSSAGPPARWGLRLLLAAAALALLFGWPLLLDERVPLQPDVPAPPASAPRAGAAPRPPAPVQRVERPLSLPERAAQEARMAGETPDGIALFNPPGTKPIKRGLVVPEGFELPPGFMRHYQTLDDGRQLPAVLTFHPDAKPTDAQGRPVEVAPDRLVPPELAPPGLPLEYLEVPETLAEQREGDEAGG